MGDHEAHSARRTTSAAPLVGPLSNADLLSPSVRRDGRRSPIPDLVAGQWSSVLQSAEGLASRLASAGSAWRRNSTGTKDDEALMPTFSRSLEQSLRRALALANKRHRKYATLEHLLLALIDDVDALVGMKACKVDLGVLKEKLVSYIDSAI